MANGLDCGPFHLFIQFLGTMRFAWPLSHVFVAEVMSQSSPCVVIFWCLFALIGQRCARDYEQICPESWERRVAHSTQGNFVLGCSSWVRTVLQTLWHVTGHGLCGRPAMCEIFCFAVRLRMMLPAGRSLHTLCCKQPVTDLAGVWPWF